MSFGANWPKDANGKIIRRLFRPVVDCSGDEVLTKQFGRDETDINKIIARFEKTGQLAAMNQGQPFYGDVSEFTGLHDAIIKVQEANDLFMAYPASVRERFDNDPVKFVEFFEDPANLDEAVKLGLALPRPVEAAEAPPAPLAPPA